MTYRNIAIMGKARSGKDSLAEALVEHYTFTRLAFADPLREAALKLDPIVETTLERDDWLETERLSQAVAAMGWERAKDRYPEVRRILQRMGQGVRDFEEDFWLDILLRKVDGSDKLNMPVVVTDVRYPNEAWALRDRGFLMVRAIRPYVRGNMSARYMMPATAAAHPSETALDSFSADVTLHNNFTLADWQAQAPFLVRARS